MFLVGFFDISKIETYNWSKNLNTLGDHMKHCGKALSKRESKSFVSRQRDNKFSF
jgi:hypothetical protein